MDDRSWIAIEGSRHPNIKELRPGSTGRTEVRVLFALDKQRKAILLVGGDKSDDRKDWYKVNVPIADDRFDERLAQIKQVASRKVAMKRDAAREQRRRRR